MVRNSPRENRAGSGKQEELKIRGTMALASDAEDKVLCKTGGGLEDVEA